MGCAMRRTFQIEIESPYGKQPIEQFEHFMQKIKSEALERWGIEISITDVGEEP